MYISVTKKELNITGEQAPSAKKTRFDDSMLNSLGKINNSNAELAINNESLGCSLYINNIKYNQPECKSVTDINYNYANEHILIETYRRCALDEETIYSLYNTTSSLRNYITNYERNNIKNGRICHNTFAAIATCDNLKKHSLNMCLKDLDLLNSNPLNLVLFPKLNKQQIISFLKLAEKEADARTIQMLADAGVIYRDLFNVDFAGFSEEKIRKKFIENMMKSYTGYEHINTHEEIYPDFSEANNLVKDIERLLDRDFKIIKTDDFLRDWVIFGFSSKPECQLNLLGRYVNYTYSDLTYATFRGCNFTAINLMGSYMEGCNFLDCNFTSTEFSGVTMYNSFFFKNEIPDILIARDLINRGIDGVNIYDYFINDDTNNPLLME